MKRGWLLHLLAAVFLSVAVLAGRAVKSGDISSSRPAARTVEAGLGGLAGILADILWLQLDDYHHIWMYQGHTWDTATDYLPHLWLITRLKPDFPDAYIDGGYHLAVNLGHVDEGLELLDAGIRNCPDNERVFWERLIVLWETGRHGPRAVREAAWDYLGLVRRKRGDISEPWNEANASMIIAFTFREDTLRRNSGRIHDSYMRRRESVGMARIYGLWRN